MRGKDIEWRIGGSGGGAADQGRDIEACFYMADPDGELVRQKWWIEAKGRTSSTVPATEVKKAVHNAAGRSDVDVLVVATNSIFSNPTRDWIREWQRDHPRPKIRLWDQQNLESLVCQNPEVAVRLFASALSPQGQLEVVKSRFWDYAHYATEATLKLLWSNRRTLDFSEPSLLAVQASEFANGNVESRPWALLLKAEEIPDLFGLGLLNTLYFCIRSEEAGGHQKPYIKSMAYLLLLILDKHGMDTALRLLKGAWDEAEDAQFPEEVRQLSINPIVDQLRAELRDLCTADCRRVTTDPFELGDAERESYWNRLTLRDEVQEKPPKQFLIIEHRYTPCKVGFDLGPNKSCPIVNHPQQEPDLAGQLMVLAHIIKERRPPSSS